jgi:hypothetical protein
MKVDAIKRFVPDSSVNSDLVLSRRTHHKCPHAALELLSHGAEAVAPAALVRLKLLTALLTGEKRQRVTAAQVTSLLWHVAHLPISLDPVHTVQAFSQIVPLARQAQSTAYDAKLPGTGVTLQPAAGHKRPATPKDCEERRASSSADLTGEKRRSGSCRGGG